MSNHTEWYVGGQAWGLAARVMVPHSQFEDAKRIRETFDAGDYAIDEDFDVNQ